MEFWIGLSVGMHLGKIIADYLEKYVGSHKLLDASALEKIEVVEGVASEVSSIVDEEELGD